MLSAAAGTHTACARGFSGQAEHIAQVALRAPATAFWAAPPPPQGNRCVWEHAFSGPPCPSRSYSVTRARLQRVDAISCAENVYLICGQVSLQQEALGLRRQGGCNSTLPWVTKRAPEEWRMRSTAVRVRFPVFADPRAHCALMKGTLFSPACARPCESHTDQPNPLQHQEANFRPLRFKQQKPVP